MKAKIYCFFISIIILINFFLFSIPTVNAVNLSGYLPISNKNDLYNIRNNLSGSYYLTNNIYFTDEDFSTSGEFYNSGLYWEPIGNEAYPFTGLLDGNGYSIIGLKTNITFSSLEAVGLFGYNSGILKNFGMVNGTICVNSTNNKSMLYVGSLAGVNNGTITNCYNSNSVYANSKSNILYVGGLAGFNSSGTISNCYNIGIVWGNTVELESRSGGITGMTYSTVSNCYNSGNIVAVTSSRNFVSMAAGISGGSSQYQVKNCYYLDTIKYGDMTSTDKSTRCTLDQLKNKSTYIGFDFNSVWTIKSDSEFPFPTLKNVQHIERQENIKDFSGGNGTNHNPYLISTASQLNRIRNSLNDSYCLTNDIVFSDSDFKTGGKYYNNGAGWSPIGSDITDVFGGVLDGKGFSIKNIKIDINTNTKVFAGVFGCINGTIKNLGVSQGDLSAQQTTSFYSAPFYIGGIAGFNNSGYIINCYYSGKLSTHSYETISFVGGILGYNYRGSIENSYFDGNIKTSASHFVGGICGNNTNIISNSFNLGTIDSISNAVGGITGQNFNGGIISSCYNAGNIIAQSTAHTGGIVGINIGYIVNSYNIATVKSLYSSYIGGICGFMEGRSGSYTNIQYCYNSGNIIAENENKLGGIVGWNNNMLMSDCFYIDTVGKATSSNFGTATMCTLNQLTQQETFLSFDFNSVWKISNGSIPYLQGIKNTKLTNSSFLNSEVTPMTKLVVLKNSITPLNGCTIKIFDQEFKELTDNESVVGTGITIQQVNGGNVYYYSSVVVYGDVSGDGVINVQDLIRLKQDLLDTKNLEGIYKVAGDLDREGSINILDLMAIKSKVITS